MCTWSIFSYLEENEILSDKQTGFRPNRSIHVLLRVTNDWKKPWILETFVPTVLTDLSKAFDSIKHDFLLRKLYDYNINTWCRVSTVQAWLVWFTDYLSKKGGIEQCPHGVGLGQLECFSGIHFWTTILCAICDSWGKLYQPYCERHSNQCMHGQPAAPIQRPWPRPCRIVPAMSHRETILYVKTLLVVWNPMGQNLSAHI